MRLLVRPRRQGQKTSAGACFNVTGRPNGAKGAPLSPGLRRTSPPEVKFRASIGSKRKENSPRARSRWVRHRHLLRSFESPRTAVSECWPISPSPFAHLASTTTQLHGDQTTTAHAADKPRTSPFPMRLYTERFSSGVRTDLPMSKYCSHGNLLHFGLQCSQLNIRYYNQDLHWVRDPAQLTLQAFDSRPTPTYTALASTRSCGLYERAGIPWVVRLSIVHFRGWCIRQVSCYTLHSGFRLPWPPPCCLDAPTPFMVSDERTLWYLRYAFGSSRIASPAYQAWPTWGSDSRPRLTEAGGALRPLRV